MAQLLSTQAKAPTFMEKLSSALTEEDELTEEKLVDTAAASGAPFEGTAEEYVAQNQNSEPYDPNVQQEIVNNGYAQGLTAEEVYNKLAEEDQRRKIINEYDNKGYAISLLGQDPELSAVDLTFHLNRKTTESVLGDLSKKAEGGKVSKVGEFVDRYLVGMIARTAEDLTSEKAELGQLIRKNQVTMDPKEFKEWFTGLMEKEASEGLFSGEVNYWSLMEMIEATEFGGDPYSSSAFTMGLIDVATAGTTATLAKLGAKAVKGALKSSTAVRTTTKVSASQRAKKVVSANTPAQAAAAAKGANAGASTAVKIANSGVQGAVADEVMRKGTEAFNNNGSYWINEARAAMDYSHNPNRIVDRLSDLRRAIPGVSEEELKLAIREEADRAKAAYNNGYVTSVVTHDEFNNYSLRIIVGDSKGNSFVDQVDAEDAAEKWSKKSGLQVDVVNGPNGKGHYLAINERLNMDQAASADAVEGVTSNLLARLAGSTRAQIGDLAKSRQQGGGVAARIREKALQPEIEVLQKVKNPIERDIIDDVLEMVRDSSVNGDFLKRDLTVDEFKAEYARVASALVANGQKGKFSRTATQDHINAYEAALEISRFDYIEKSTRLAHQMNEQGFRLVDFSVMPGEAPISRVATPHSGAIPDNARIIDQNGKDIPKSKLKKGSKVWEVQWVDGRTFVVDPTKIQDVMPENALGYNSGGRRIYTESYAITIGPDKGFAILTAKTRKRAAKAVEDLKRIAKGVAGRSWDDIAGDASLDKIIKANNSWNPSIKTASDLAAYAKERSWPKMEEGNLDFLDMREPSRKRGLESFDNGSAFDFLKTNSRRDIPMDSVEGNGPKVVRPMQSIVAGAERTVRSIVNRQSNYEAKTALLKRVYPDLVRRNSSIDALWAAKKAELAQHSDPKVRSLYNVIQRREGNVYGKEVSREIDEALQDFTNKFIMKDATPELEAIQQGMLAAAFKTIFSLQTVGTFIVQAAHMPLLLGAHPINGSRSIILSTGLTVLSALPDVAMKEHAKRGLSKALGLSKAEMDMLEDFVYDSGRLIIDGAAAEKDIGASLGLERWRGRKVSTSAFREAGRNVARTANKAVDMSLFAFNQGERLTRFNSMALQFLNMKSAGQLNGPRREVFANWSAGEHALNLNMTAEAKSALQTGITRLPLQFFSYPIRAVEAMVTGGSGQWSKRQRAQFAIGAFAMGGLSSVNGDELADNLSVWLGYDKDSMTDVLVRNGWVDAIISGLVRAATDSDEYRSALGTRISVFSFIFDVYNLMFGKEAMAKSLGGASISVLGTALVKSIGAVKAAVQGDFDLSLREGRVLLRQVGGINSIMAGIESMKHGEYRSRSGTILPVPQDEVQSIMRGLGITDGMMVQYYSDKNRFLSDDRERTKIRKEANKYWQSIYDAIEEGDDDKVQRVIEELRNYVYTSPHLRDYEKRDILERGLRETSDHILSRLVRDFENWELDDLSPMEQRALERHQKLR